MAEIETSVLRIESNDLVLQDAAVRGSLAAAYSASSTYAVGDMVLKDGQLYECNTAITTAEAWTAAHWTAVTVGSELSDLKSQLSDTQSEALSAYATDTASGAIASFPDGADDVPVKSLTVAVEPVQDLHGQANPYPAGGGVNKLPPITAKQATGNGVTFKSNGDGTYSITGTASAGTTLDLTFDTPVSLSTGTYYVSYFNTAASGTIGFYAIGTSSNNLWDTTLGQANRTFTNSNIGNDSITALRCYVASGVNANVTLSPVVAVNAYSATFAPYENICPISGHTSAVVTVSPTTDAQDGTSYTIDLDGTRYGGTLDVTTGVLTVDMAIVDLGTLTWQRLDTSTSGKYRFGTGSLVTVIDKPSSYMVTEKMQCSILPEIAGDQPYLCVNGIGIHTNGNVILYSDAYASYTVSDLTNAVNGQTLVYPLATPQTVQLTAQEVTTLKGQNNVWNDCGDTTVEYRADTKLYIDKKIAEALS